MPLGAGWYHSTKQGPEGSAVSLQVAAAPDCLLWSWSETTVPHPAVPGPFHD